MDFEKSVKHEIMVYTYLIEHCANDIYVVAKLEMNDRNIRSGLKVLAFINRYLRFMDLLCLSLIPCIMFGRYLI